MADTSGPLTGCPLSVEQCHRLVARKVVRLALSAACSRLGLSDSGLQPFGTHNEVHIGLSTNTLSSLMEVEEGGGEGRREREKEDNGEGGKRRNYLTAKTGSTVSESRVTFELPQLANSVKFASDDERPTLRQGVVGGTQQRHNSMKMSGVDEQEVRTLAKKLVRAVLRMACKQWESFNRRSSIEYLIASTKRMRIGGSPTPPLPVAESPTSELERPALDRSCTSSQPSSVGGKKRSRSESHDVFFMKELERFRESHLGQQKEELNNSFLSVSCCQRGASKETGDALLHTTFFPRQGKSSPEPSIGALASDIGRMSIAETTSESECGDEDKDTDEYLILSAVTKSLDLDIDNPRADYPQTVRPSLLARASKYYSDGSIEGCEHVSLPRRVDCPTVPQTMTSCSSKPRSQAAPCVPNMDLFVIVHSYPKPGRCQKFLCNNTNELNLLYHCWLYPDIPCDPSVTVTDQVEMGIFCPQGVQPVHLDLVDGGIAFLYLDRRLVYT